MKTIKVGRMPLEADHFNHTHWEVVADDRAKSFPLEIPDDCVAEIGMRWNGNHTNPTAADFRAGSFD